MSEEFIDIEVHQCDDIKQQCDNFCESEFYVFRSNRGESNLVFLCFLSETEFRIWSRTNNPGYCNFHMRGNRRELINMKYRD